MALIGFQEGGDVAEDTRDNGAETTSRIGHRDTGHLRTFHGPVEVRTSTNAQVITFVGSEEADVLHAAGDWLNENHNALVIGINWYGDFLSPYEDQDGGAPADPPRHRMDLTVSF
jgi:hypothetical protein